MITPIWQYGAGQRNQVGFLFPIQASGARPTERTAIERGLQSLLRKRSSYPHERRRTYLQRFTDLFIRPAWPLFSRICLQQDPGVQNFAGGICSS
jgi:hypothetical protein